VTGEQKRLAVEWCGWAVAVFWLVRTHTLQRRIGEIPDLSTVGWDLCPARASQLVVVVPAKDEAETIRPAMETLLAQDYRWMFVVAVDDRSTDATGAILDEFAAVNPQKLGVAHLTETPEGWLGKTFAMEYVRRNSQSDYVLFTDADVWFSPSILRRALAYAEMSGADHLVVAPTPVTKTWGERTLIGFLQLVALWASPPWRVSDPKATWNVAAAGAFNLFRRDALEEIGGLEPQRLAVVEDITLGRRVRAAGLKQRLVFAPGLVLVHWAPGAWGLIRGMTKNLFAAVNFRTWMQVMGMLGMVLMFLGPLAMLGWRPTLAPGLLTLLCVAVCYRIAGEINGIPARYGWLYPLGALGMLWAMLRSMVVTWWHRGVLWRGTLYPLRELRQFNSPFSWEWEAAKARAEKRKVERVARSSRWVRFGNRLWAGGTKRSGRK
jgi:cellulose synthase/poly-beta-1,6-N-acetylglucosamine synthase-like glycosyltransferase